MIKRIAATRKEDAGFTLIELLVVIVILGILSAVVVFAVRGSGDKGRKAAVATDQRIIRTALELYCARNGHYPAEPAMKTLVDEKFLSSASTYYSLTTAGGTEGNCPGQGPAHYNLVEINTPPSTAPPPFDPPPCGSSWCNELTVPGVVSRSVTCSDSPAKLTTCVAVGRHGYPRGYQAGDAVVYRGSTVSGSETIGWAPETLPPAIAAQIAGLTGVDCVGNICTAVGYDEAGKDVIVRRTVAGDWQIQYKGGNDGDYALSGVSCPSEQLCVAVGTGVILRTDDGGATPWKQPESVTKPLPVGTVGVPTGVGGLFDVDCPDSTTTCLAVGVNSDIVRSVDGGRNWSVGPTITNEDLIGVTCLTGDNCFAAGHGGVFHYVSGAWTNPFTGGGMYGISCFALRCYAVGPGGNAISSTDGGNAWSVLTTPSADVNLFDVSCTPTRCRAVGSHQTTGGQDGDGAIQKTKLTG